MSEKTLPNLWAQVDERGRVEEIGRQYGPRHPHTHFECKHENDELYIPARCLWELVRQMQKQKIGYQNALEVLEEILRR